MTKKILSLPKKHPLVTAAVSGVVSALPYVFPQTFFLSYFSFVPFVFVSLFCLGSVRKSIGAGFFFGIAYYLVAYSFFLSLYPITAMEMPNGIQLLVAVFAYLVSSLLHGLVFVLVPLSVYLSERWVSKKKALSAFLFITACILAEKAAAYTELAFPWTRQA
ncbi:MAG: hypothetical protein MJ078_07435, partial [Clostridia bacterium]|nr:hypothetical protein [Clostridia bacterium]